MNIYNVSIIKCLVAKVGFLCVICNLGINISVIIPVYHLSVSVVIFKHMGVGGRLDSMHRNEHTHNLITEQCVCTVDK